MNGRYLLDTNIIISLFAGEPQIHARLARGVEIFVPSIAIGELYFGAYKSLKPEENLARIDEFALNNTVLPCATVHEMDYLMTWNCQHLANAAITKEVAKICRQQGFECPVICTPEELLGE